MQEVPDRDTPYFEGILMLRPPTRGVAVRRSDPRGSRPPSTLAAVEAAATDYDEDEGLPPPPDVDVPDSDDETAPVPKALDPANRAFDANLFVSAKLRDNTYADLAEAVLPTLDERRADAAGRMRQLVHDHLGTFVGAKDEMDLIYAQDRELFTGAATEPVERAFNDVAEACAHVSGSFAAGACDLAGLQRARAVLSRAADLLHVPELVYNTCGVEAVPPIPDDVLAGLRGSDGPDATSHVTSRNVSDSDTDSDASSSADTDASDDGPRGGSRALSRLAHRLIPKAAFAFHGVILQPVEDTDGAAGQRSERRRLAKDRDLDGAVQAVRRALLFLEDHYHIATGLPRREHALEDGVTAPEEEPSGPNAAGDDGEDPAEGDDTDPELAAILAAVETGGGVSELAAHQRVLLMYLREKQFVFRYAVSLLTAVCMLCEAAYGDLLAGAAAADTTVAEDLLAILMEASLAAGKLHLLALGLRHWLRMAEPSGHIVREALLALRSDRLGDGSESGISAGDDGTASESQSVHSGSESVLSAGTVSSSVAARRRSKAATDRLATAATDLLGLPPATARNLPRSQLKPVLHPVEALLQALRLQHEASVLERCWLPLNLSAARRKALSASPSGHAIEGLRNVVAAADTLHQTSLVRGLLNPRPPLAGALSAAPLTSLSDALVLTCSIGGIDLRPLAVASTEALFQRGAAAGALRALGDGSQHPSFCADDVLGRASVAALSQLSDILHFTERAIASYWSGIGSRAVHKGLFDFAPPPCSPNDASAEGAVVLSAVSVATGGRRPFRPRPVQSRLHALYGDADRDTTAETLQLHDRHIRNVTERLASGGAPGSAARQAHVKVTVHHQAAAARRFAEQARRGLAPDTAAALEVLGHIIPPTNAELSDDLRRPVPVPRFTPVSNVSQLLAGHRAAQVRAAQMADGAEAEISPPPPVPVEPLRQRSTTCVCAMLRNCSVVVEAIVRTVMGSNVAEGLLQLPAGLSPEAAALQLEVVLALWERLVLRVADFVARLKGALVTPPPVTMAAAQADGSVQEVTAALTLADAEDVLAFLQELEDMRARVVAVHMIALAAAARVFLTISAGILSGADNTGAADGGMMDGTPQTGTHRGTLAGTTTAGATAAAEASQRTTRGGQEARQRAAKTETITQDRSLALRGRLSPQWPSTPLPTIAYNLLCVLAERCFDTTTRLYELEGRQQNVFAAGGDVEGIRGMGEACVLLHRLTEGMVAQSAVHMRDAFGALVVDVTIAAVDAVMHVARTAGRAVAARDGDGEGDSAEDVAALALVTLNIGGMNPEEVVLLRAQHRERQRLRRLVLIECAADVLCLQRALLPLAMERLLRDEYWVGVAAAVMLQGSTPSTPAEVFKTVTAAMAQFEQAGGAAPEVLALAAPTPPAAYLGDIAGLAMSQLVDSYVAAGRSDIALEVELRGFARPGFDWHRYTFGAGATGPDAGSGSSSEGVRPYLSAALMHVARAQGGVSRITVPTGGGSADGGADIAGLSQQIVQRLVAFTALAIVGVVSAIGGASTLGMSAGLPAGLSPEAPPPPTASMSFEVYGLVAMEAELEATRAIMDRLVVAARGASTSGSSAVHPELIAAQATSAAVIAALRERGRAACEYAFNRRRFIGAAAAGDIPVLSAAERAARVEALVTQCQASNRYLIDAMCGAATLSVAPAVQGPARSAHADAASLVGADVSGRLERAEMARAQQGAPAAKASTTQRISRRRQKD